MTEEEQEELYSAQRNVSLVSSESGRFFVSPQWVRRAERERERETREREREREQGQ